MTDATNPQAEDTDDAISLARHDLLYRVQQRLGLVPPGGTGALRRALFWSMLAWLPTVAWSVYAGRLLPSGAGEALLSHFGVHTRFLVAVPLFLFAEGYANALTTRVLPHFLRSGIVPASQAAAFRAVLRDVTAWRDATLPWVAILGVVLAAATVGSVLQEAHEVVWDVAGQGASRALGPGAWWFLVVGRSIYLTLMLAWIWRVVLMARLFHGIAGLELSLVPTHPDAAGGLGFLERLPSAFAPVVFGISAVLSGGWAHEVLYHQVHVTTLRPQMAAFVAVALLLFLSPLLVFARALGPARRQAMLEYGTLVGEHGRLVRRRWIEGRALDDDALLTAPELGPVADTVSLYEAAKAMRVVPLGKSSAMPLVVAAALPILPVLAIEIPLRDILKTLAGALL